MKQNKNKPLNPSSESTRVHNTTSYAMTDSHLHFIYLFEYPYSKFKNKKLACQEYMLNIVGDCLEFNKPVATE